MADRANRSVYTSSTAGHRLGYSDERIRQMCEAGRFPGAFRDGHAGHWRIPAESIDAFLESVKPKVRRKA